MSDPLPPLTDEAFDGEKESHELTANICFHKKVTLDNLKRELRCECGACWSGFGVDKLYDELMR